MSWDDWLGASQPKIQGTWNIHNALLSLQPNQPLDFFFLFSSTAATGGWWGQANYHAGNTFLESFVSYRHSLGLAASALNVGFISETGYVADRPEAADSARATGQKFNTESELLDCIELMLSKRAAPVPRSPAPESNQAAFVQKSLLAMGLRSTVPTTATTCRLPWRKDRRMLTHRNLEAKAATSSSGSDASLNDSELTRFVREVSSNIVLLQSSQTAVFLATEIGKTLLKFVLRPEADLNLGAPLSTIGIDSLVSLEVRAWIRRWMGVDLVTLEIMKCADLQALGAAVQSKMMDKYHATRA